MLTNIFPTKIEIINNFLTQDEINNVYSYIKKLTHTDHSAIIGEGQSTYSHNLNFLKVLCLLHLN